jgi:hypothetical protein
MAFDISKLARACDFSLEMKSLGTVRCLSLTADHFSQARTRLNASDVQSLGFVRWLLGEIVRRPVEKSDDEDKVIDGPSLTEDELNSVTDGELEEFADKLIQKNKYLFKTHKGNDIEKSADESDSNFVVRAFLHHAAEEKAQWERLTQSASASSFAGAALEAMESDLGGANRLREAIDKSLLGTSVAERFLADENAQRERITQSVSNSLFGNATLEAMQTNLGLSNQLQDTIDKYTLAGSATERILSEEKAQRERMTQLASPSFLGDAAAKAMQDCLGHSDRLHDTIGKYEAGHNSFAESAFVMPDRDVLPINLPRFDIPKNPIHETNAKLESVVNQIEDLRPMAAQAAQLIRSMNDAALRMQADYIENAKTAGRQTRIAIWIAAVSLVVSAIGLAISSFFSYQSYIDGAESGKKSEAQIAAFQKEIRNLATAQREERAALLKAIGSAAHVSAPTAKK